MKYVSLVLLGMLVSVLAGCGGGGDGGKNDTIAMLEADLALVQADLDAAQSELATTKDTLSTTEDTLTTTEADLATAQSELATTKDTLATTMEDLDEANNDLEDREAELTRTQADLTTAQSELDTAEGELSATQISLATANANLTNAQNNLMMARADLTGAQNELDEKITELSTTQTDLTTAQTNLMTAQDNLTAARADLMTAQDDLAAETIKLSVAQADLKSAQDNLDTARNTLTTVRNDLSVAQTRANNLQTQVTTLTNTVANLRTQLGQAQQQAQNAQGQVNQLTQQADANERARGLLMALEAIHDGNDFVVAPVHPATAGINDRGTDIQLTATPLTGSTRRSGDFYTATLTRTAPGVNQPQHKVVAYTDRERSRTFAEHYASSINAGVGGTTSNPRFVNAEWVSNNFNLLSTDAEEWVSSPSSGGHPSTIANGADDPADREVPTLSATVHGVSGRYGCYISTSNQACRINVAAVYDPPETDAREELISLTITPEAGGTLYFDPGSGTISLLGVAKAGAPPTTDGQYITFGWWQESPAMSDGTYSAAVFATTTGAYTGTPTGSAEYEGPTVGLYVDRTSEGGTTTYESGEFTATTVLRATFDTTGTGTVGVQGDVSNFRTAHGAKNWHVSLNMTDATAGDTSGDAEIVQTGTNSTGTWERTFLARHADVATTDTQPISVTGRFDVSIPNLRHITGAFGAHRTTDPIE